MQDHTMELARGLAHAGHTVEVISSRHPRGLSQEWRDGVRWRYVAAPPGDFTNKAWLRDSHAEFLRAHAERPFDVIHSEGSSALELVRRRCHTTTPLVVMFHGNFLGLVKASLRRQLAARRPFPVLRELRGIAWLARRHFAYGNSYCFRPCEAIVPSRQQLLDTCRSHHLEPTRMHVVPNGVDTSVFRPRPRTETRRLLGLDDGFLFVCVGRLNREKGTHHAISALGLLERAAPAARLLVVGDGEERSPLERLTQKSALGDRVVFAGEQSRGRVALYLAAADAFLFPTERDEAAPLVLPQAMACGLPVIASDRGSVAEVIDRPGQNGLLVPAADVPSLVDAMARLHRDEALRMSLGHRALKRVEEEYTLERSIGRTVEVYEVAVGRARRERRPPRIPLPSTAS
jgi:glycosyltransferase involved in cell wall biosynthesis